MNTPLQALADLATLTEHFGDLNNIQVLYMGEGNNTASALALALSRIQGAKLTILTLQGTDSHEMFSIKQTHLLQSMGLKSSNTIVCKIFRAK